MAAITYAQDQRQPLERMGDRRISQADRRDGDADAEREHPGDRRHACEQVRGVGHAAQVGADIDRVGDEQRAGGGGEHKFRRSTQFSEIIVQRHS